MAAESFHSLIFEALVMPQVYEPFYADFGPLNLGLTYRFGQKTQNNLQVIASMANQ